VAEKGKKNERRNKIIIVHQIEEFSQEAITCDRVELEKNLERNYSREKGKTPIKCN